MASQTITFELPEHLYRTVHTLAQVTKRPLAEIVQKYGAHFARSTISLSKKQSYRPHVDPG